METSDSMDELRIEIWDLLFRSQQEQSIGEIAQHIDQEAAQIQAAVDHEWFRVNDGVVSISRSSGTA